MACTACSFSCWWELGHLWKVYLPRGHLPGATGVIPTSTPCCKAPLMDPALPGETHAYVRHSTSQKWAGGSMPGKLEREPPGFLKWRNFSFNFLCFHDNSLKAEQEWKIKLQQIASRQLRLTHWCSANVSNFFSAYCLKKFSCFKVAVASAC